MTQGRQSIQNDTDNLSLRRAKRGSNPTFADPEIAPLATETLAPSLLHNDDFATALTKESVQVDFSPAWVYNILARNGAQVAVSETVSRIGAQPAMWPLQASANPGPSIVLAMRDCLPPSVASRLPPLTCRLWQKGQPSLWRRVGQKQPALWGLSHASVGKPSSFWTEQRRILSMWDGQRQDHSRQPGMDGAMPGNDRENEEVF
jgi:hypothetical protein